MPAIRASYIWTLSVWTGCIIIVQRVVLPFFFFFLFLFFSFFPFFWWRGKAASTKSCSETAQVAQFTRRLGAVDRGGGGGMRAFVGLEMRLGKMYQDKIKRSELPSTFLAQARAVQSARGQGKSETSVGRQGWELRGRGEQWTLEAARRPHAGGNAGGTAGGTAGGMHVEPRGRQAPGQRVLSGPLSASVLYFDMGMVAKDPSVAAPLEIRLASRIVLAGCGARGRTPPNFSLKRSDSCASASHSTHTAFEQECSVCTYTL